MGSKFKEKQLSVFSVSHWQVEGNKVQSRASVEGSKEDLITSLCDTFDSEPNGQAVLDLLEAAIAYFYNVKEQQKNGN